MLKIPGDKVKIVLEHAYWWALGSASVALCVLLTILFMAPVFRALVSQHRFGLFWLVVWLPFIVPAVLSIVVWRKSPAYAIAVVWWSLYGMLSLQRTLCCHRFKIGCNFDHICLKHP